MVSFRLTTTVAVTLDIDPYREDICVTRDLHRLEQTDVKFTVAITAKAVGDTWLQCRQW